MVTDGTHGGAHDPPDPEGTHNKNPSLVALGKKNPVRSKRTHPETAFAKVVQYYRG